LSALRDRIRLGIALHAVVNISFALAITMSRVPVAEASASVVAPDPSPALESVRPLVAGSAVVIDLGTPHTTKARVRASAPSSTSSSTHRADRFDRLAACESGGDARALSPTGGYRGAFQFSRPTWDAAGGTGDPIDSSYAEQKRVAITWSHVVEPDTQWPVCWSRTA
jgi:hypothetical protein